MTATLAPRRSTAAELLRLMAAWLAVVLALQGVAAAFALARGPVHSHREPSAALAAAGAAWVFSHHEHQHRTGERHFHAAGDPSVLAEPGADGVDALAFALTAALALLAFGAILPLHTERRGHVWRTVLPWARVTALVGFPFKPPRMG